MISKERAIHLARKYGGEEIRSSGGFVVSMNQEYRAGEWLLHFVGKHPEKYYKKVDYYKNEMGVVVTFDKDKLNNGVKVSVFHGPMAR